MGLGCGAMRCILEGILKVYVPESDNAEAYAPLAELYSLSQAACVLSHEAGLNLAQETQALRLTGLRHVFRHLAQQFQTLSENILPLAESDAGLSHIRTDFALSTGFAQKIAHQKLAALGRQLIERRTSD